MSLLKLFEAADDVIVPATRLGPNKMISQDYDFKAYMPSGVAKFWTAIRDPFNR